MKYRYRKLFTNAVVEILKVAESSVGNDSEDTKILNHQL